MPSAQQVDRQHRRMRAVGGAELLHDMAHMHLDGRLADIELVGDDLVRLAGAQAAQDIEFLRREQLSALKRG